jgi:Spy/CpxP family protein refolding chaperone
MARAAELNGFPGPRHVLDLHSELGLDQATIDRAQQLFDQMKSEAQPLGAQVVALEKSLGEAFASQTIDETTLTDEISSLAALMGQLREVHLRAHIRMKAALSPQQVARYDELRGYPVSHASGPGEEAEGADADAHSAHHQAM